MKRIEFIAPVEALRGNMSGSQTLVYAENDNPAYDAPDGRQYARNYKPRYIGYRRAKDGAVYFGVKRKSATKVDTASKITMAALGTIQDLKNTFKNEEITTTIGPLSGTYWGFITLCYQQAQRDGEVESGVGLDKWIDGLLIDMLRYRVSGITLRFKLNPSSPNSYSLLIPNPYVGRDQACLPITQLNFKKFCPVLSTEGDPVAIYINGTPIVVAESEPMQTWADLPADLSENNPNYTALLAPLTATGTATVTWNNQTVYSSAGTLQTADFNLVAGEKYTTIAPRS